MKKLVFTILATIFLASIYSCARLPDYALPKRVDDWIDPALIEEAFTYRQLTRTDFQAASLPPDRAVHAHAINAHTCARIRPTRKSQYRISRAEAEGTTVYVGSIKAIAFEAVMIPGCSWWNPTMPASLHDYVLEHEQIHFALTELTARRLTLDAQAKAKTYLAIQLTFAAAQDEIMATIQAWIQTAAETSLVRHTAFDKDTSLAYSRHRQQWWLKEVTFELAQPVGASREAR